MLPTLTSNMKVSTSSLISSSVRGSPFCDVCSSKSRKFMCRLLPRIKEDNRVFYSSFTRAYICVCIHISVCIYIYMHMVTTFTRPVVTMCTTSLTFSNPTFCPHSVFMCFVWISEQTAIISLYNINWLVCITETECVYCAVRTGCLNVIRININI